MGPSPRLMQAPDKEGHPGAEWHLELVHGELGRHLIDVNEGPLAGSCPSPPPPWPSPLASLRDGSSYEAVQESTTCVSSHREGGGRPCRQHPLPLPVLGALV